MKKFLSIMLAAILVIACLATTVFAAGSAAVSGSTATTVKGGEATVVFSITEATFANYKMKISYNKADLELLSIQKVGGAGSFASYKDLGNVSYAHSENETLSGGLFSATFKVIDPDATCKNEYPVSISVSYVTDTKLEDVAISATGGKIVIGHQYESVVTDPTCTAGGYTTYTCSVCGDTYTGNNTSAAGHNYTSVVTDPTCTAEGYTTYTCSDCGHSYVGDNVAATGHNYVGVETKPANCTETGIMTYTCSKCGHSYTEDIPTNDMHDYESVVTDPTCTDKGYTTHTCSRCGDSYVDSYTDALGHDYVATSEDATCQVKGKVTYTCSRCGHSYVVEDEFGPHEYTKVVTDPTCTDKGYTTYTCSVCGHSYVDDYTDVIDHDWNNGKVTKKATCGEDGEKTYTCKHCGETKTEVIPATGKHEYEWKYNDKQHWKECSVCGHKTEAEDHDFSWVTDKKPTKTEFGEKHEECECGCTRNEGTVIDKLKDDLDEVPDTGDITPHIVLGTAALIAMLAAVAYVFKRKAVK